MKRNFTLMIVIVAVLALSLGAGPAMACGKAKCSEVSNCKTEKTADGFRCTMMAKDESEVEALREMVRSCAEHKAKDDVYVSFEDIEGGVVMIASATDPDVIEKLHARADACAGGECGCGGGCHDGCGCQGGCTCDHDCCKGEKAVGHTCGGKGDTV